MVITSFDDKRSLGDAILGNHCAYRAEQALRMFVLDLHCVTAYVVARIKKGEVVTYEILYWRIADASKENLREATKFFDSHIREQI